MVAHSTAMAEFQAMKFALCKMIWPHILMVQLRVYRHTPLKLFCDNQLALNIADNPVQQDRTKHVEINWFFIKEKLDSQIPTIDHVQTTEQLADYLTKSLSSIALTSYKSL